MPCVVVYARNRPRVDRLVAFCSLYPLADHIYGPNQFAPLGGVIGQNLGEFELAGPCLGEETATDFLRAVIPQHGIESRVAPAYGAIALDIANQIRLRRLRGEGSQPDHQRHCRRPCPTRPRYDGARTHWLFRGVRFHFFRGIIRHGDRWQLQRVLSVSKMSLFNRQLSNESSPKINRSWPRVRRISPSRLLKIL